LPLYSKPIFENNNLIKMSVRFQRIDKNGNGLHTKDEMISAHSDRIAQIFMNFDKNGDIK